LSNIPGDVDLAGRCLAAFALSHVTPGAAVGPILDVLDDAAPALQLAAARALARIGPAAAAAAPALRRLLNAGDEELAENAAHALAAVAGQVGLAELTERLNDPAPAMRELAIAPLAEMAREHQSVRGPLLAALGDPSPRVRLAVASTLRTFLNRGDVDAVHPLREALTDSEEYVRSQAANCLGRLRSAASPSVPDLIRATRDPAASVRRAAVAALDGMQYESPEMLVALVAALDDPDQSVCHAAATGLAAWSRLFPDSAAAIFARARHPDRVVRRGAILLLGKSAQADPELIAFLRETLQNEPDDELRVAAADSLGRLGAVSPDLTTHLVALLDATGRAEVAGAPASLGDPPALEALDERLRNNPQMRPALVGALKQSAAHSTFTSLVDGLTACLSDSNPPVREQAAQLLGDLGGAAASAIDALRQCTADADGPVREAALVALANASPDPATVFADLARGVTDPDLVARQMAVLKLNELPLPDSDKLSLLRPALQDENRSVRQAAASGLQALGPAAAPATTDLLLLLHDEFHEVRADAAAALGAIGPAAGDVVPALRRLLSDAEPFVRSSAAFALCSFGPAAADAEPELVRIIMEDQAANVRSAAAEALHSIGRTSSAAGAVVMLRRKLLDPDGEERGYAAATLGGLGPIAVAAVPELLAALRDPAWGDIREQYRRRQLQLGFRVFSDEQLDELAYDRRIHVAEALGRIGLADHAVIAALREAADDGDQLVSRYAVVALGRLQPASESALRELLDHVNDVIRVDAARELQAAPPSAENVSETDNAS
jgi:HEAT repeat protein